MTFTGNIVEENRRRLQI